jgi:putative transcriptional regulator
MRNRLKELRQLHQWSQADLARELGVSRQAVNGFESGRFKIASLFNVAIEGVFIHEAKRSMQTLVERVKKIFGFEFGFEQFTEKAVHALILASNEAGRLQDQQVEPKHLLFGLLVDPTMTSAQLLRANGATVDIEIHIDVNEISMASHGVVKYSPKSDFILELALQIARLQGTKSIGTEHLLWGLVRLAVTDKTTLGELFQSYGININTLNDQLDRLTNFVDVTRSNLKITETIYP